MVMKTSLFLSCAYVTTAHNWLKSPLAFGGASARTQNPCETKSADYTPTTLPAGTTSLPMEWSTNHAGNHFVRIIPITGTLEEAMAQIEAATKQIDVPGGTGTLTIPGDGNYLVQYGWNQYRNCLELNVGGSVNNVGTSGGTGSTGSVTCSSFCTDYLKFCDKEVVPTHAFDSEADCMAACVTYPDLKTNNETVTGNSLQCRMHHLHVEDHNAEHCAHASQSGGGTCVGGASFNVGASITVVLNDPNDATAVTTAVSKLLGNTFDAEHYTVEAVEQGTDELLLLVTFTELQGFDPEMSIKIIQQDKLSEQVQALPQVKSASLSVDKSHQATPTSAAAPPAAVAAAAAALALAVL